MILADPGRVYRQHVRKLSLSIILSNRAPDKKGYGG